MKFFTISKLLLFLFLQNQGFSQEQVAEAQDSILVGKVTRSDLQTGSFGHNFIHEYRDYEPDQQVLNQIGDKLYNYDITMILGTWCSDSKLQVPRFYKVLDLLNFDTRSLTIYAVDKEKNCGDVDISGLDLELVPTFILMKNGEEKGRIIESPQLTLEKDLLGIVKD